VIQTSSSTPKSDASSQTKSIDCSSKCDESSDNCRLIATNHDRPAEDGSRCVSSASSTCTYASCSSNYASDASSSSYTYSGLDASAASQRISRSAILQNFHQKASGAASTSGERIHGSQSTDSGNHSDESLGVDETTLSSVVTSVKSDNRIVIDVPPPDTYEPLQSEHIYEELRCGVGNGNGSYVQSSDSRSIFEGASRQQILEYLADAKRRVERLVSNGADCDLESLSTGAHCSSPIETPKRSLPPTPPIRTDSIKTTGSIGMCKNAVKVVGAPVLTSRASSSGSECSDCSECIECTFANGSVTIERQDSGVGPETSASACVHLRDLTRMHSSIASNDNSTRTRSQSPSSACVDCEQSLHGKMTGRRLLCNKCDKRRTERKEIIAEFVDTEFKYGRDLRIIREEFHRPIRVAGLLSAVQLDGVFANLDELIQVNSRFSEKLQDTLDLATEQGDTVIVHFRFSFTLSFRLLRSPPPTHNHCNLSHDAPFTVIVTIAFTLLFRLRKRTSQACTSVECSWIRPKCFIRSKATAFVRRRHHCCWLSSSKTRNCCECFCEYRKWKIRYFDE
jgi:hypothetical protein